MHHFAIGVTLICMNKYFREHDEDYELIMNDTESIKNSTFDPSHPTKVAIHGYEHSYKDEAVQLLRDGKENYSLSWQNRKKEITIKGKKERIK